MLFLSGWVIVLGGSGAASAGCSGTRARRRSPRTHPLRAPTCCQNPLQITNYLIRILFLKSNFSNKNAEPNSS